MRLPDLLPKRLHFIGDAPSDDALFTLLKPQTAVLVDFFENACEDEMWCQQHLPFFTQTIEWLTTAFFQDKIALHFAKQAVAALQKHFQGLSYVIPKHLTLLVHGEVFQMNSLMVGVVSHALFHQIRMKCSANGEGSIKLEEKLSTSHFHLLKKYIENAHVEDLWKSDEKELFKLHEEARELGITGFLDCCADILKRYLTGGNVLSYLIISHDEMWASFKNYCIDYINRTESGISLKKGSVNELIVEFLEFNSSSLAIFSKLKTRITHLICSGSITLDPHFGSVIHECPRLVSLDLSQSLSFGPYLTAMPPSVESLDLSMCPWLDLESMSPVAPLLEELKRLALRRNTHLSYVFWPVLLQLPYLEVLDIAGCVQIGDAEAKIIAEVLPDILELHLEGCSSIRDRGFRDIAKQTAHLRVLNVSRTEFGDEALLEFASVCPKLNVIILERCTKVTERGILEAVRLAGQLQKIVLTHIRCSSLFIKEMRIRHPYLECVF